MNVESQMRDLQAWKAPKTPERRRLVVDSKDATSRWESTAGDMDDVLDEDGAEDAAEAVREEANRLAEQARPSADQIEQAKLDDLREQLGRATQAVSSLSPWKKLAGRIFSGSELALREQGVQKLRGDIRAQEDVVRDLSHVISKQFVDSIVPALEAVRKKQFWAAQDGVPEEEMRRIRQESVDANGKLESAFFQINRELGAVPLTEAGRVPKTNEERKKLRETYVKASVPGNSVRRSWAEAGLRLLSAYEKFNPTQADSRKKADAARMAEFQRTGPMESTNGALWTRMNAERKPAVPVRESNARPESEGENLAA